MEPLNHHSGHKFRAKPEITAKNAGQKHFGPFFDQKSTKLYIFCQFGVPFFQGACFCWEKKWPVSEARGVVRVRLLPWPPCLPDEQNHAFVTDSDPHGSKSGSEGIPWQLFSTQIFWEEPNPAMMSKMERNIKGFGSGFSDFSDFPQMENRGLRWIGLGLGSPKTIFPAKKLWFLSYFWPFPIIWGFPLGGPPRYFLS